jgi:hypothetical protein
MKLSTSVWLYLLILLIAVVGETLHLCGTNERLGQTKTARNGSAHHPQPQINAQRTAPEPAEDASQLTKPQAVARTAAADGSITSDHFLLLQAETETDPDLKSEALQRTAASVADRELPAVLDSLLDQHGAEASELRDLLVRRWADLDAKSAASWSIRLSEGSLADPAVNQVAISWANADLSAAMEWAQSLPEGDLRQTAVLGVGYEAARTNAFEALELATGLPPSVQRDELLVHAVKQWTVTDPENAAIWAGQVTDPALRDRLASAVATAAATRDSSAAVSFLSRSVSPGQEQERAAVSIIQRWAQTSPEAAAVWVEQFPDTPVRTVALQSLVMLWNRQDANASLNWLEHLPEGSLKRSGLALYSEALL